VNITSLKLYFTSLQVLVGAIGYTEKRRHVNMCTHEEK